MQIRQQLTIFLNLNMYKTILSCEIYIFKYIIRVRNTTSVHFPHIYNGTMLRDECQFVVM